MTVLTKIASDHQRRRVDVSDRASREALLLWRSMPAGVDLDSGWDLIAPKLETSVKRGQTTAARQAVRYSNRIDPSKSDRLVVEAFAGVSREGREVAPELFAAVTQTKSLVGRGVAFPRAFEAGAAFLATMAATLIRDAGRGADQVSAVSKGYTRSVRVVQAGACSRCAILAGVSGYKEEFQRHPGCRCTMMPISGAAPDGFHASPEEYFGSLSESEQERVFTKAGAFAIRNGANPVSVVNVRRSAYGTTKVGVSTRRLRPVTIGRNPDGSPLQVYATAEGTARGRFKRSTSVRLMPEQIMRMSQSAEHARELLTKYGYLY